jgi:hypothetical protein
VQELGQRRAELDKAREQDEAELRRAESGLESFAAWQRNLATLKRSLKGGTVEVRERLRSHLRELLHKVEVFSRGHREGEDDLAERLWSVADEYFGVRLRDKAERKTFGAFVDSLAARRATKEGRFVRLFFKGDGRVDLVPDGSLATGWAMGAKGELSKTVRPDFDRLWTEFQAEHEKRLEG